MQLVSKQKCFDGFQMVYDHLSESTQSTMRFGIYLPPQANSKRVPVLYWLSGLTCTEQNFITKAGAQRVAAQLGVAIVAPDTSPREMIQNETPNIGIGASFYVDATASFWVKHFQMQRYIAMELPKFINAHFPIDEARSGIFGHSMGGHGALMIALKYPSYFKSVSAFAPIASARCSPWGAQAYQAYFADDEEAWNENDVIHLLKTRGWKGPPLLIDQGLADPFLEEHLQPKKLETACAKANIPLMLRFREGYDHSYFFVATFIEEHIQFHKNYWI